jgi:hypothetical protein
VTVVEIELKFLVVLYEQEGLCFSASSGKDNTFSNNNYNNTLELNHNIK